MVFVPPQELIVRAGRRLGRGDDGFIGQAGHIRNRAAALTVKRHRDRLALRDGIAALRAVGIPRRGLDAHLERGPARKVAERTVRIVLPGGPAVGAVLRAGAIAGELAVRFSLERLALYRQRRRGGAGRRSKRRPAGGGVVVVLHLPDIEGLAQVGRDAAAVGNRRAGTVIGGADLVAFLYSNRLPGIVQRVALASTRGRGADILGDGQRSRFIGDLVIPGHVRAAGILDLSGGGSDGLIRHRHLIAAGGKGNAFQAVAGAKASTSYLCVIKAPAVGDRLVVGLDGQRCRGDGEGWLLQCDGACKGIMEYQPNIVCPCVYLPPARVAVGGIHKTDGVKTIIIISNILFPYTDFGYIRHLVRPVIDHVI